jgi:tetratricopeptide (TPR) repeat protein
MRQLATGTMGRGCRIQAPSRKGAGNPLATEDQGAYATVMRSRAGRFAGLSLIWAALAWPAPALGQGFNPQGRKKPAGTQQSTPKRAAPADAPATPKRRAAPAEPPSAASASAVSPSKGDEAAQSADALIARYTAIVLSQPGEEFPLERLAQLYRERDGKLDALVADFERRAAASGASGLSARITLAGIYVQAGDAARAIATYDEVARTNPERAVVLLRLAELLARQGDKAAARKRLEQALLVQQPDVQREQALRSLLTWSLDDGHLAAAKSAHERLVKLSQNSFFVRAELGRELLARGRYSDAEAEYRELVKLGRGDNRTLAPALKELGQALFQQGKYDEAEQTLNLAESAAGAQSGLRQEILEQVVLLYRATERLPLLISKLESSGTPDNERLLLLASLYEETGRVDDARKAYERALSREPRSVAARLKVIQLLSLAGELDQVVVHYEQLLRFAPHNPEYVFRLAETHLSRGDRKAALAAVDKLTGRAELDEDMLAALVEFYERLDEGPRALALLEQLAKAGGERHLIELGDRYYAQGDQERALKTWQRIAAGKGETPRALHTLGEVYLEHDMPEKALEALKRATVLEPNELKYKKSLALALERSGAAASTREQRSQQYGEAQRLWEQMLERASKERDGNLARESRQHIVTLWGLTGTLEQRTDGLTRRLEQTPPDLEAGRLLAEAFLRLGRYRDAEHALRRVLGAAPTDLDSHLRLERALVQSGRTAEAIAVLEQVTKLEPARAREYYQRMGRYAAELYQDEQAIEYTRRAVELSPDDAEGHFRLGEMYRRRQDTDNAILEFRRALSKNDRLFAVHFQLAELLLNRQEVDEADQLLRRVLRASPDEQLIANATRLSIQIHLGRGTLEQLEKELLPLALANPTRPLYRRLLVELYGSLAFPLANEAASPDPKIAARARESLERLGQRAVGPLLNALGDNQDTQQRVAIELLSHIRNKNAGPALLAFASGDAEGELRVRAMIAAGALRDPELYDRVAKFLHESGGSDTDPVAVAAAWAVAHLGTPRARPLLLELTDSNAAAVSAIAVLGLAALEAPQDARLFGEIVRSSQHGPLARAAAAHALAELGLARAGARVDADIALLTQSSDIVVRASATLSLARLRAPSAARAIAEALVSRDPELVDAAVRGAALLAGARTQQRKITLPVPEGRVDVRLMLAGLAPRSHDPDDEARALVQLAPEIADAALRAVQSSPNQARAIADLLLTADGQPAFTPLTARLAEVPEPLRTKARAAVEQISHGVVEPFLRLVEHPSAEVRSSVIKWLSSRPEPEAQAAVLAALGDADPDVQRSVLGALGKNPTPAASFAIADVLARSPAWPIRLEAARALAAIPASSIDPRAVSALATAAEQDKVPLVREAAARALASADPERARPVLQRLKGSDPEIWVKDSAATLEHTLP